MKKLLIFILVALLTVSLSACLSSGGEHETKDIVSPASSADETSADISNETEADTKGGKNQAELPTIEEQVCFENAGIKVTAKAITDDTLWGTGVKLLIENSGEKTCSVSTEAVIVNDCMVSSLFSCEVAAGKKANDTLYLSSTDLKSAGIENIGKIEIYFYVYDSEEYERVYTADCVTLKTSLYDKMDSTPNDMGHELFNENGIRIVGKYVDEDSIWGTSVLLYIENHTERNIRVSCREMSINGFMVSPLFSADVYAEKYAIDDITVFSSDLEENDITDIEDIELKFHIYDDDTYDTIVDTPAISFSVK